MDHRRHAGVEGDTVNIAIASSHASIYRECVEKAGQSGAEVPNYTYFVLQFWSCSRIAANILHCTGRFKVKRMIQTRLFRKNYPDTHYCNALYKFMKKRAIKHRTDSTFCSADAKCKVYIGEPDFPLASVPRGKKVLVGVNESFKAADHDFSKVSLIPDAIFAQDIPELQDEKRADEYLYDESKNSWFRGQVYYGVKNMVTQAITALRGVAEMGKILDLEGSQASRFFAITDGGEDQQMDYLSLQKSLIGLFLHHDMDEILVCRPAAGLSYRNSVERVHAIANLGLQYVGIMRQKMRADMEERIINCNSNDELRKASERH